MMIDKIRNEFPILETKMHGKPLVYLDSAATSLKPKSVVERLSHFYNYENANVHRAAHELSASATENFEKVRKQTGKFINASSDAEIIFSSGTTASINLLANSLTSALLKTGDEIILSEMEHHSNIVPWYMAAKKMGLVLKACRVDESGELDLGHLDSLITKKTKIISVTFISNVLGTINPVKKICKIAKDKNIFTVIDAAQAMAFMKVDVQDLDCDFLVFSAHKMLGPFGVGVLYGKKEVLEKLPPFHGGGGMIDEVAIENITFADVPFCFEAGTPNISGVIAFGKAIEFLEDIGFKNISKLELDLRSYMDAKLREIKNVEIYGKPKEKAAIISFNIRGAHASDVASIVDQMGIAVRAGHHCAQILMRRLAAPAVVRASFGIYNDRSDVDKLIVAVEKARELLL